VLRRSCYWILRLRFGCMSRLTWLLYVYLNYLLETSSYHLPRHSPSQPSRSAADHQQATGYWHWFFLIQPSPQVEEFILTDPKKYWEMLSSRGSHTGVKWSDEDVAMYQEGYFTKEGIHAVCLFFLFPCYSDPLVPIRRFEVKTKK